MKTHSSSPRAAFRILAALLVIVALLFAAGASAQSTNWLSGTNVFSGAPYGTLADNDVVDNATLIITNGGPLTANQLNVGPTNRATLTLEVGGALAVNTLLATNILMTGATTNLSLLNFNAGTLTTSNNNGLASVILLASNVNWTMNSSWTMNAGTNVFRNVATNGNAAASVYVGNATNNVQVNVNSNAVWWNAIPVTSSSSNTLGLIVGNGPATNNIFTVNGGSLISTNGSGTSAITVGNSTNSVANQLTVTNGGQVFTKAYAGQSAANIGGTGSSNSLVVAGANAAGLKSTWTFSGERLSLGNPGAANGSNNWVRVDAGGVITNCDLNVYGTSAFLFITNGGQMFAANATFGRMGLNSLMVVGGFDAAGNSSLLRLTANGLTCGGGTGTPTSQQPGTNVTVRVDTGGIITNANNVFVGKDTNSFGNTIFVINGGRLFSTNSAYVGYVPGGSNGVIVGGAFGTTNSLWANGGSGVIIGNSAAATNSYVTLNSSGVLTNVGSLTFGGVNSLLAVNSGATLALTAAANGNVIANNGAVTPINQVSSGGLFIIDTVGFTVTNQLPLQGGGSLTKLGTGTLVLNGASTYTGPTILAAGTLGLNNAAALSPSSQLDITGSAGLRWGGGITTDLSSQLKLEDGITATFDTGTNSVTLASALPLGSLGTAGLTKAGAGTLTLGGNTYTGPTTVSAGTLLVEGDLSAATGAVTVSSYAALGSVGSAISLGGNVTLAARANLVPAGYNSIGALNVPNLTLNGDTLYFDISNDGTSVDTVNIANNLTLSGTSVIVLNFPYGPAQAATYTLMNFAASSGPGTVILLGSYPNAVLTLNPTSLTLTVGGSGTSELKWTGAASGLWDIGGAVNWTDGVSSLTYADGDAVLFDDTASANFIVTGGAVSPGSVTFSNAVTTYTNSAAIGGAGPVVKLGSGAVTLNGSNSFSGGLTLNAGTLRLGSTNALGTGFFTINGGTLDVPVALTNVDNNAQAWNNDFTFAGTANLNLGTGAVTLGANSAVTVSANTLTVGGAIGDGAANGFTKLGAGTLSLNANSTYTGPTLIGAGTVIITNAPQALGGTAGGTSVSNGAALKLYGGITVSGEPLTLLVGNTGNVHLQSASGSNVWTGPITVTGTNYFGRVEAVAGTALTLSGPINVDTNSALTPANGIQLVVQGDGAILISGNITNNGGFIAALPAWAWRRSAARTATPARRISAAARCWSTATTPPPPAP